MVVKGISLSFPEMMGMTGLMAMILSMSKLLFSFSIILLGILFGDLIFKRFPLSLEDWISTTFGGSIDFKPEGDDEIFLLQMISS
jgi:hypothetical protein